VGTFVADGATCNSHVNATASCGAFVAEDSWLFVDDSLPSSTSSAFSVKNFDVVFLLLLARRSRAFVHRRAW
jgi:hypothetical protein